MFQELQAQNAIDNEARCGKLESEVSSLKTEILQLKDLLAVAITERNIGEPSASSKPSSVVLPPTVVPTKPQRKKRYKEVDAFAVMIPRIVKEVQLPQKKKILNVAPYSVMYVPVANDLNKNGCDCGVYALKFIECHVLGLHISLVNDDNIEKARIKIATDLLQAATDEVLVYRMSQYQAPTFETPSEVVDVELVI
ncbi:unnamed protein product [Microthlaspi erraticum]|uniref:Ubiquitin-like protease family profile domain-containing protein n=1 Tax=Microthlaspi erraticum TaxID=1685480 RepID=A0A6D2IF53_9BRAS|nr:unnamed protein product [Microthlaspi erraticum]